MEVQSLRKSSKLNVLKVSEYSESENDLIIIELTRLLLSRNEVYKPEVVNEWINSFRELNYNCREVLLRIKVAKISKRFGNFTTLADFTDCDNDTYMKHYKEIYEIIEFCDKCGYEKNIGKSTMTVNDHRQKRIEHTCGSQMDYKYK
jgi:hypothetical protein